MSSGPECNVSLSCLIAEYNALKTEQSQRIVFRDRMVFVHLAACGAVGSWAASQYAEGEAWWVALLLVPWMSTVLGWAYIANDYAVRRIGWYIRDTLNKRANELGLVASDMSETCRDAFGWETYHRTDLLRKFRKRLQCTIDVILLSIPGICSVAVVLFLSRCDRHWILTAVCIAEAIVMVGLAGVLLWFSKTSNGKLQRDA